MHLHRRPAWPQTQHGPCVTAVASTLDLWDVHEPQHRPHSDVCSQTPAGAYKLIIINTFLCNAMCVCVRSGGWTASHHLFVCLYLSLSLNWHVTAHFFHFVMRWIQFHEHNSVTTKMTNFVVYRLKRNITSETFYFNKYFRVPLSLRVSFCTLQTHTLATKKLMNISIIYEVRYSSLNTLL